MNIEYHQTSRYPTGVGSLIETTHGGVTAKCAEELACTKLLSDSKANLAFCRCFLTYRAVFIKNSYGGMFLLACVSEWTEEISTPFFDPDCHNIAHHHLDTEPTVGWVDAWVIRVFNNKKVKVAVLSYGQKGLFCALMRDNDEITIIAGEAGETKLPAE